MKKSRVNSDSVGNIHWRLVKLPTAVRNPKEATEWLHHQERMGSYRHK